MTKLTDPTNLVQMLTGKWNDPDRLRPNWARPIIIVCHIQAGYGNLFGEFLTNDKDSTMQCLRSGQLVRFLPDTVSPWTNGDIDNPNLTNPLIRYIYETMIPLHGATPGGVGIYNHWALTIEHEGQPGDGLTTAQLESTAKMCAYWCQLYNMSPDIAIVGHRDIGKKTCPGSLYPFDKLKARVKELLQPMPTIPPAFVGRIGLGMQQVLKDRGLTPATEELYTIKDRASELLCTDGTVLKAYRDVDPNVGTLLSSWTVRVFKPTL